MSRPSKSSFHVILFWFCGKLLFFVRVSNTGFLLFSHLDLPAIIWLQNYLLQNLSDSQTIVVVSHDRNFLNTVSQEIIRLRDHKLDYFPGNYDEYEMKLEDKAKMKDRISAALEKKRKHAQDTINKQRSIMNKTGDDKRGAVIASRQKVILFCFAIWPFM